LTGTIEIALAPGQAFTLFTPTGERAWAPGWDPQFPSPGTDETEPGTVFRTDHGDKQSIWAVFHRDPGKSIGYVVTTPGERCGLVTVNCQPTPNGTKATVVYDLTSLSPDADAELELFAANYPSFLSHWQHAIAWATEETANRSCPLGPGCKGSASIVTEAGAPLSESSSASTASPET
jgi:hypothetical protein